jgi:hypothetical protein
VTQPYDAGLSLLCRVDTRLCALPLATVLETLRRLSIEPLAGAPAFVLGRSVIRGAPDQAFHGFVGAGAHDRA